MKTPALNDLDGATVQKAYQYWAPIYDVVCGSIFERSRQAAARAARDVGGRILEIGIGTGLSFEHYKGTGIELYGIDLSEPMLEKARRRVQTGRYPEVKQLQVADAHELKYPDGFFSCTVAQFVITLVARPEAVLSECARVVRPGGEIILVSHFYSERGLSARLERMAAVPLRRFGLRPEFPISRLEDWAKLDGRAEVIEYRKVGLLSNHTLVRFRRK